MAIGKKLLYFPNLVFTMVRTNLPPNQVAFRVPINVGKLDIRDYLLNLYQVKVKDVRTMNYQGKLTRDKGTRRKVRLTSYKKAIVTLEDEFEYPVAPEPNDFGKVEADKSMARVKSKLKGWRIRSILHPSTPSETA